ncbi:heterokaryon incompatibility protein-domain-containing protein [Cladorrhinum sp. PSN259]|nr:heterokaryon incompatibility protein-domain-containing protein [Cladorrhinum sp. PSN259]
MSAPSGKRKRENNLSDALRDYQIQLLLLETQNKRRMMECRADPENILSVLMRASSRSESQQVPPQIQTHLYDMSGNELQSYVYRPLEPGQQTRLIQLHPASNPSEPLRCDLVHVNGNGQRYSAISYAWSESRMAILDPALQVRTSANSYAALQITPSLHGALRALRSSTETRVLWADAVCINQSDNGEKAHQVRAMGEIYANSSSVQIWLGEDYEDGERALRYLSNYMTRSRDISQHQGILDAIRHIFQRPWFRRRWIVQEVIQAKTAYIHCGSVSMEFEEFVIYSSCLITLAMESSVGIRTDSPLVDREVYDMLEALSKFRNHVRHIRDITGQYPATFAMDGRDEFVKPSFNPIYQILHDFRAGKCKDDRDRVYALLGISDNIVPRGGDADVGGRNLPPPYLQAQIDITYEGTTEDVYTDLTLALWKASLSPLPPCESLHYAGAFRPADVPGSRLQSWVPDWRARSRCFPVKSAMKYRRRPRTTWVPYQPQFVQVHGQKGLGLSGWKLHTVDALDVILQARTGGTRSLRGLKQAFQRWVRFASDGFPEDEISATPASHENSQIDGLLKTMVGRKVMPIALMDSFVSRLLHMHPRLAEKEVQQHLAGEIYKTSYGILSVHRTKDYFYDVMKGRTFVRNHKHGGLLFNVPDDTMVGDTLWIFDEEDSPFVLRPVEQDGVLVGYRLIGDVGTTWEIGEHRAAMEKLGVKKEWKKEEIVML